MIASSASSRDISIQSSRRSSVQSYSTQSRSGNSSARINENETKKIFAAEVEEKQSTTNNHHLTSILPKSLSLINIHHQEKCLSLQSTINSLELKLSLNEKNNRDDHRVKLIKNLRNQLRESLTENEVLLSLALSRGVSRELIEEKISRALSKIKVAGVKRVSEMRREIGQLKYELKQEKEKRKILITNQISHNEEKNSHYDNNENNSKQNISFHQFELERESLIRESAALTNRLKLSMNALDDMKNKFSLLSADHSKMKIENQALKLNSDRAAELEAELIENSNLIATASVAHRESSNSERAVLSEMKRLRAREEKWKLHEAELLIKLKEIDEEKKLLIRKYSHIDEELEEKEEKIEEIQKLLQETKNLLKQKIQHRKNLDSNDREELIHKNFELEIRCKNLIGKNNRNEKGNIVDNLKCSNCSEQRETIAELNEANSLLRLRLEAREDDDNNPVDSRADELEAMTEMFANYEKERKELKEKVKKLEEKLAKAANQSNEKKSRNEISSSDSESDAESESESNSDSDDSVAALEREFSLDL